MRRLTRASAAASVLAALLAAPAGCGTQPVTAPAVARVTIASRMVVHSCTDPRRRQGPLPVAVLLDGRGRRLRVDTGARGYAGVRLTPGRYSVAPLRPALRHAVVSLRFDGRAVRASRGGYVVDVAGGRHRILLLVALRPVECNGLGTVG